MADLDSAAIITGGTKGLGRALSIAFGEAGYQVLALFRSDRDAAAALEREASARGLPVQTRQHDVTEDDFPALPSAANLVLINNAAADFEPKPMHLLQWKEFQESLDVNVRGSFLAARAVLRTMAATRGGTIVNVLSRVVDDVPKGFGAYVTAKYALMGLTRALASEYRSRGIRVFAVSPGFMHTALTSKWHPSFVAGSTARGAATEPRVFAEFVLDRVRSTEVRGEGECYSLGD